MNDQYFTPSWLAARLAMTLPEDFCGSVVDPTAGDGALLSALKNFRPATSEFFATDLDLKVFAKLRVDHSDWHFGKIDIFNRNSRLSSGVWRKAKVRGIDVVVSNPPFSYIARRGISIEYAGQIGKLSPAASVCAISLQELSPKHAFIGVLPSSTFHSEMDAWFWDLVRMTWSVDILEVLPRRTFRDVRAETMLIKIAPLSRIESLDMEESNVPTILGRSCVQIFRGKTPMHKAKAHRLAEGVPLIHTTNLQENGVSGPTLLANFEQGIDLPLVLLPRVGAFQPGKISFVSEGTVALSDCVIGLRGHDERATQHLHEKLLEFSCDLSDLYRGTAAPYITVSKLKKFVENLGYRLNEVGDSHCCYEISDLLGSQSISA